MSANTSIQWTNKSWNPIAAFLKRDITVTICGKQRVIKKGTRGWFCVKCSPGCANCYAEGINIRLGNGLEYLHRNLDHIEFRLVNLEDPLKWRKPCMVFVNSMTDLFLEHIPDEMIDQVFAVMAIANDHTFQILTKRAARMEEYMRERLCLDQVHKRIAEVVGEKWLHISPCLGHLIDDLEEGVCWPLRNVWLGVSVEDQNRADERIPLLIETPAEIRFLSCEPLLGPLDLLHRSYGHPYGYTLGYKVKGIGCDPLFGRPPDREVAPKIQWVIVGGESGPKARPCNVEWVRDIVAQCKAAGVAVFVKQLGANVVASDGKRVTLKHKKGGDLSEWPMYFQRREFPASVISETLAAGAAGGGKRA